MVFTWKQLLISTLLVGRLAADSLPQFILKSAPACAQQCFYQSIRTRFGDACADLSDVGCLCSRYDSNGYSIGEIGFSCLYSDDCQVAALQAANSLYNVCTGLPGAVSPTHKSITAAVVAMPGISTSVGISESPLPTVIFVATIQTNKTFHFSSIQIAGIVLASIALAGTIIATLTFILWLRRRRRLIGKDEEAKSHSKLKHKPSKASSIASFTTHTVRQNDTSPLAAPTNAQPAPDNWPRYYGVSPPRGENLQRRGSSSDEYKTKHRHRTARSSAKRDRAGRANSQMQATKNVSPKSGPQPQNQVPNNVENIAHPASPPNKKEKGSTISSSSSIPHPAGIERTRNVRSAFETQPNHAQKYAQRYSASTSGKPPIGTALGSPAKIAQGSISWQIQSQQPLSRSASLVQQHPISRPMNSNAPMRCSLPVTRKPLSSMTNLPRRHRGRKSSEQSRESSATEFESDCDIVTEDEAEYQQATKPKTNPGDRSPIFDLQYPRVPRSSNNRTPAPVIAPRTSIMTGALPAQGSQDKNALAISTTSLPTIHSESRSSTPSTAKTNNSPRTPTAPWSEQKSMKPHIVPSSSDTPISALESAQNSKPSTVNASPPPFVLKSNTAKRVIRQDLPQTDVYQFF